MEGPRHYHHYYHGVSTPGLSNKEKWELNHCYNVGEFVWRYIGYNVYGVIPGGILALLCLPVAIPTFIGFQVWCACDAHNCAKPIKKTRKLTFDI